MLLLDAIRQFGVIEPTYYRALSAIVAITCPQWEANDKPAFGGAALACRTMDNRPEFIAQNVRDWTKAVSAQTVYIKPGSPWDNCYCESLNARFKDEFLNGEIFCSLKQD